MVVGEMCVPVNCRVLRSLLAAEEEEAQIMAGVPGWTVGESIYHTDKWIPPHPSQLKDH